MIKPLFTFLFVIAFKQVFSQIDESKNFVYLYNDSVIFGTTVDYKTPFLGRPYFLVDTTRIEVDKVKFYNSNVNFFANIKATTFSGSSDFAIRTLAGKVNMYQLVNMSPDVPMYSPSGFMTMGGGYGGISDYYNKGYGEVKKAKYANLLYDLSYNLESMAYLKKYRNYQVIKAVGYSTGGVMAIVGLIKLISATSMKEDANSGRMTTHESEPDNNAGATLMGIGAGTIFCVYISTWIVPNFKEKAIKAYNK